jgi:PAS domain S-box-containing protein
VDTGIGQRDVIDERAILDLDALLANSPLILVAFDRDNRLSYWSSRARDAFGFEPIEVLGKLLEETQLIHPDDLVEVLEIQARLRNRPADAMNVVNRMLHRDGTVRTFRWSRVAYQKHVRRSSSAKTSARPSRRRPPWSRASTASVLSLSSIPKPSCFSTTMATSSM